MSRIRNRRNHQWVAKSVASTCPPLGPELPGVPVHEPRRERKLQRWDGSQLMVWKASTPSAIFFSTARAVYEDRRHFQPIARAATPDQPCPGLRQDRRHPACAPARADAPSSKLIIDDGTGRLHCRWWKLCRSWKKIFQNRRGKSSSSASPPRFFFRPRHPGPSRKRKSSQRWRLPCISNSIAPIIR